MMRISFNEIKKPHVIPEGEDYHVTETYCWCNPVEFEQFYAHFIIHGIIPPVFELKYRKTNNKISQYY